MTAHAAAGHIADHYYLDARIFTDPQIFAEELDKLFGHAWLFLGHECEAKEPSSYFCFEIGGTPVVICRNTDGRLHGFIDACRECDGTVVTGRWGKGPSLRCAAGHAAYDLNGQAVEGARKEGLEPVEIETLFGLVYGSLAPYESLRAFLGPALISWWEPRLRTDVEWELIHIFSFPTAVNWKAFMQPGDGYHVQGLHRIFAKYALPKGGFYKMQSLFSPAYGHVVFAYPPLDYERFRDSVWGNVTGPEEAEVPTLAHIPEGFGGYVGQTFPNMFYSIRNGWVFAANAVVPRGPERMVMDRRAYCRAGLTAEQKQIIQREEDIWSYPMGLNGQDDLANFEWQQKALRANTLPRLLVARYPGENPDEIDTTVRSDSEAGYRSYFRRWRKYMEMKPEQSTREMTAA